MLSTLHIEYYALIRHTDLALGKGLAVITGETGAGKSILLGALGLLVGQRADSGMLYDKDHKCIVEATFDIEALGLETFFTTHDLDYDKTLTLRREILPSGKSRAFVNDTPAALSTLKELGQHLIDIHSQHDTLLLNDSAFRIALLDQSTTDNGTARDAYRKAYDTYIGHKRHLEQLTIQDQQNRKEADYLQFIYNELHEAHLTDGEQEELEKEAQLLTHAEDIKQQLGAVTALCDGEENGAVTMMKTARTMLSKVAGCHKDIADLEARLNSCLIELRDILDETATLNDGINYSPERQEEVNARLDLIYRLEKKHGIDTIGGLQALHNELEQRLNVIANADDAIRQAMEEVDKAYAALQKEAGILTTTRTANAKEIEKQLLPILAELGMKEARINIVLESLPEYTEHGGDHIAIMFNANKGGEMMEIGKVASGGELSRIMLALKAVIARKRYLPTIIFDEIDTGISGDISVKTGRILRQMALSTQVVAITHQPQMAAAADQQMKVYKQTADDNRTISNIMVLNDEERISEIAKMLSSDHPTAAALQTARELIIEVRTP